MNRRGNRFISPAPVILVSHLALLISACGGGASDNGVKQFSSAGHSGSSLVLVSSSSLSSFSQSSSLSLAGSSFASSSLAQKNTLNISWVIPNRRVNGEYLDISEIGGYELRYKREEDKNYTKVIVNDNHATEYLLETQERDYEFFIATFDAQGLYSEFVRVESL